ncbi:hypothetical protein SUDANB58_03624 [Streptomyces sp. enrichment culture]|uniref:hypothetical protein n=1 Tax=Streptomyces sp. enrichment culture TaxID=1795815 RepID=UPI003F565CF1
MEHEPATTDPAKGLPGPRPPAPPAGAEPVLWNTPTRHMCAGAWVDESFARAVVRELEQERHRAWAPSYGVDQRLLLHHARRALEAVHGRDMVVSAAWLAGVLVVPAAAVARAALSKLSAGVRDGVRRLPGMHSLRREKDGSLRVDAPVSGLAASGLSTAVSTMLCAYVQTALSPWGPSTFLPALLCTAVLLTGVPWWAAWRQQKEVWRTASRELVPGAPAPAPPPGTGAVPADEGNLVIHSGYRPFTGSGTELTSWSLDLRLRPAPGAAPAAPLTTDALVDALRDGLGGLGRASGGLTGLSVEERVYVDGCELDGPEPFSRTAFWPAGDHARLTARPVDRVPEGTVRAARGRVDGPVRHCLCAQVRGWDCDIVLTVHVQAVVVLGTLHLNSTASVLTPVRDAYREVDRLTERHHGEHTARVAAAALLTMHDSLGGPIARPLRHFLSDLRRERREEHLRDVIAHDRRFDFGAGTGLRERAGSGAYTNYFQRVDVQRAARRIELRLLADLGRLLEDHGLDTSELEERRSVILNNGVIMTGGAMHGAVAAGPGAQAVSGPGGQTVTGPRARPDAAPAGAS